MGDKRKETRKMKESKVKKKSRKRKMNKGINARGKKETKNIFIKRNKK